MTCEINTGVRNHHNSKENFITTFANNHEGTKRLIVKPLVNCFVACAIIFLSSAILKPAAIAQESDWPDDLGGYTLETIARGWAITTVFPVYPEEALRRGVESMVEVRLGITDGGEVAKVKVPPGMNSLFRKAVVVAAKQWKFKPRVALMGPGKYQSFRLTFRFFIKGGEGHVELAPVNSKIGRRLKDADRKALVEWKQWEDATDEN